MKIYILILLFCFCGCIMGRSQQLPNGLYIGYERMFVGEKWKIGGIDFYPGAQAENIQSSTNDLWYHQVILMVHNDSVTISKVPIRIENKKIAFSDSTGGFYCYKGKVSRRMDSSVFIYAYLDYTGFVKKRFATAEPRYTANDYSNIIVQDNSLILQAGFLGTLIFRRIQ